MKRFIVVLGVVMASIMVCSSCMSRHKCPAYGNHTYYEVVDPSEQKS